MRASGPERAKPIPTLGVPDGRGLRIGNAGNTHAPGRPGVCSFLRVRRASEFGIAKAAKYCARFFHTAENEKQLRARDVSYAAMLDRFTIAEIKALRARDDPMLRQVLASQSHNLRDRFSNRAPTRRVPHGLLSAAADQEFSRQCDERSAA